MSMTEFKKCPNGHYYNSDLEDCPYCKSRTMEQMSFRNGTFLKPISFSANTLRQEVNIILQLDSAPDNVKRFIEINRKNYDFNLKKQIASSIGCEEQQIPKELIHRISEMDNLCNAELLKKNIVHFDIENCLVGDYYLSDKSISSIIPDTLLTQILGRGSKLDLLYKDNFYYADRANKINNTSACAAFGDEEFQEARAEIESKKYLALSLLDNSAKVLGLHDRKKITALKSIENFSSEEISIFNPVILIKENGETILEDGFPKNYANHLTNVANNNSLSLYFQVSRQRIAVILETMFSKLSNQHKIGLMHCDLKPQNILCFKDGLMPFDPINVRKGDISAGMTTNFCAPEQILALPVSSATDIYNLGLIILQIIDGIVYGKTSNYLIPSGGTQVKNVKLLTEPMIYIDYNSANIQNKEGIPFWKIFLEKCLAFEQRNRFQNMDNFVNEYNRLIELYPLKNSIEFKPNFGYLSLVKINDEFEAAWFVQ